MSFIASTLLAGFPARGGVTMPSLFSEHMVLQRSPATAVWGAASPGEAVTVECAGKTAQATADATGHWKTTLDLHDTAAGPFEMTIQASNKVVIPDVIVGDVWLCSGQSNMRITLAQSKDPATEIAKPQDPLMRVFQVGVAGSPEVGEIKPQKEWPIGAVPYAKWIVVGPDNAGSLGGVAYYFGKEMRAATNAPVGIILSVLGGSPIQAWMSEESLRSVDPVAADTAIKNVNDYATMRIQQKAYEGAYQAWAAKYGRADRFKEAEVASYAGPDVDTSGWQKVNLPGPVSGNGLPVSGAIWLRTTLKFGPTITDATLKGHAANIRLGAMPGVAQVYLNGERVDSIRFLGQLICDINQANWRPLANKNVLAVRVFNVLNGFDVTATEPLDRNFTIRPAENAIGEWEVKTEFALPPITAEELASMPQPPVPITDDRNIAMLRYNAMIHPLIPYGLRGVIWYQGEENAVANPNATQKIFGDYRGLFAAMITDWRVRWGQQLPFFFCQIANFGPKPASPSDPSPWARIRDAQRLTLAVPGTGEAVLMDLGDSDNVHPTDKKDVGIRLAKIALAQVYGRNVVYSGPLYESMKIEGNKIRLSFKDFGAGLVARPLPAAYSVDSALGTTAPLVRHSPQSELEGFVVCGPDHKWVWADAKIDGTTVVVSSSQVAQPVAVRYAWADNPTGNLYNKADLPASSFRTDDFKDD